MKTITFFVFILGASMMQAQVQTPQASPTSKFETKVGLTDVVIEYSRPGVKDRKIFGDLVPYGTIWRAGANGSTKVTFSDDVMIKGKKLSAGTYSLFIIPNINSWEFIFNKELELWGTGNYDQKKDALRVTVTPKKNARSVETMLIDVNNISMDMAHLVLFWSDVIAEVPFTVPTDTKVMSSINSTMEGPSANDYAAAADYYYHAGKDLNKALEWINKSIAMESGKFWRVHDQALILAKMGKKTEAMEAANNSIKLAKEAGNDHYVKLNEKLLTSLK